MAELNVWGTDKALILSDEYCPECEHVRPGGHYTNCPLYVPFPQ